MSPGRGLPPYHVACLSIQPFGHTTPMLQTDRQTGQRSHSIERTVFGRPFVKRFALCYRTVVCPSVCPACNVGVLWPNGWMDQDETWHAGRPRPRPHCVTWGPSSPSKGEQPPIFGPGLLWPNGRPSHLLLSTCFTTCETQHGPVNNVFWIPDHVSIRRCFWSLTVFTDFFETRSCMTRIDST